MSLKNAIQNIPIVGPISTYLWRKVNGSHRHNATFWIQKYLSNGAYMIVQIGANDGKSGDPLFKMVRKNQQWRMLFVEPVPYLFEALKSNYGHASRFMFEDCGINEDGEPQPFYMINQQAFKDIPDLTQNHEQIGSFDRSHVVHLGGKRIEKYIDTLEVKCMTLQQLFNKNKLESIDALVIDAEGYDWKILKQLDLNKYQPRLIYFEKLNLEESEKQEAVTTLKSDYEIFTFGINFMCLHKAHIQNKDLTYLRTREKNLPVHH